MILAVAFALRVGAAVALQAWLNERPGQTFLIEGDANGYWWLAERIAAGEDYSLYSPPRRVHRMPGFPGLLAIPIVFCEHPMMAARLMLAGVGAAACGLVWWLGRVLFDLATANIAAALTAISPVMVGFSPVVLSETAFAGALVASLVAMAWSIRHCVRPRREEAEQSGPDLPVKSGQDGTSFVRRPALMGLLVGVLVAVACYVRPSWVLAGPVFGLAAIATAEQKGRAVVLAVCVVIGLVALLLPWGIRNLRVTGHFTLTTFWMGPSLYDGLNPDATGESDMTFYDQENLMGRGLSEYEVDRHYRRKAWEFVKENPRRTVELAVIKLVRFLNPSPNAEQFGGIGPALVVGPFFVFLAVCAARGCWAIRNDFWGWGLTLGPILYFAALHMVFVSSLRYRLPAEYPLSVLAAVGLRSWRVRERIPVGTHIE